MTSNQKKALDKGASMEEALRAYFLVSGFYVVRGAKLRFAATEVTDIDAWLYSRTSPVSRHRVIVDMKNKKTPQAMERICWARGMQSVLGLDQAIVATTDTRPLVAEFGRQNGVVVLDGTFLMRLVKNHIGAEDRLSEEDLDQLIGEYAAGDVSANWKGRLRFCKSLVTSLGYNSINLWLSEAHYFLEQSLVLERHKRTAARLFYIAVSLVAIGVDFVLKDLAFVDAGQRKQAIDDGLRHGDRGASGMQRVVELAMGLAEQFIPEGRVAARKIKEGVRQSFADLPTTILTEFFGQPSVAQSLFGVARELEQSAYSKVVPSLGRLTAGTQGYIGALLDYWHIDRRRVFSSYGELGDGTVPADTDVQRSSDQAALPLSPNDGSSH